MRVLFRYTNPGRVGQVAGDRRVSSPEGKQLDNRVARVAARQWGVVSIAELRECGLTDKAVWFRVRRGWLHPLHRGVYAVGHPNPPLNGRFLAATKACGPTAVLSHFSAATLFGLVAWDGRHPEVTATKAKTHKGIRVHRTASLDAQDITRRHGIATTTPARTILDLSSMLKFDELRRLVREAQSFKIVTLGELRPRAKGNLARIIATGPAPTRSELEDAVLDLIQKGRLQHPDVNVPVNIEGRRVVPDFRWPQQRLVIEADGAAWHDHRMAREDDVDRQALLEAYGERVVRVTWAQATTHPAQTLARLTAAGAPKLHGT
jgi:very-short-patch-repair endonuclease